jgi:glycosyltransferase involved in cell wall biosynthesis
MKKIALFLFLLAAVFTGSFALAKKLELKNDEPIRLSFQTHFKPISFALKNHPFTFVIVGANNGGSVAKTLASVFSQNYENYRVVYIDDASDDGSFDLARDLIYDSSRLGQVTLVQNETKLGTLANLYRAVQTCEDSEIVVVLHGEDWLAHEWVLQRLNTYYADPDLWLTYGQYRDYPTYEMGACHEMRELKFRSEPFGASHLKTFYAALFKKIRESDFVFGGKFLPASSDLAYMIPMLELAHSHSHFIRETLYIQNRQAVHREDREVQMRCEKFVRSLDPYLPLTALQVNACGD